MSTTSVTIGNFDGVHLGHQKLIQELKGKKTLFTFSNHPSQLLGRPTPPLLTTSSHRQQLLMQAGIDEIVEIPFTKELSHQSTEAFLSFLKKKLSFTHLVLGHDTRLGHQREGDRNTIQTLSQKLEFNPLFVDPVRVQGEVVSSTLIRALIQEGELEKSSMLLGRPHSICGPVIPGSGKGKLLGFQTANLKVDHLCLPPLGVYSIEVVHKGQLHLGVANLGLAPTLHADREILLEAHILELQESLYDQEIEVIFRRFLRKEKRFSSPQGLKAQIYRDIQSSASSKL